MPLVMRETDRKILFDRTVLIQCPAVKCDSAAADHPTGFCVGVIAIELALDKAAGSGECPQCRWPASVRILQDGRWAAYVKIA